MRSCVALLVLLAYANAEDYVKSIDCQSGTMEVMMKPDSTLAKAGWNNPTSPSITAFKKEGVAIAEKGCSYVLAPGDTNLTIPLNFTDCGVKVIQPEGGSAIVTIPLQATVIGTSANFFFTVSCTYVSHVTADGGFTVTEPSGGGSGGDHGGGSGSNVKGLSSYWIYAEDGSARQGEKIDNTVAVGQKVAFVVEYTGVIYQQFLPIKCVIASDKNTSLASTDTIPFVIGSCPASYPSWTNDTLRPTFFSQEIKAIEFPGSDYIYGHCELQLCVDKSNSDCAPDTATDCWGSSATSFMAMPEMLSLVGKSSSGGTVYASLKIDNGGGGDNGGNGAPSNTTTIVAATLGTLAGVLVIGLVVLLVLFAGGRKAAPAAAAVPEPEAAADPAWANNWWMFYKIPRAKTSNPPSPTMY